VCTFISLLSFLENKNLASPLFLLQSLRRHRREQKGERDSSKKTLIFQVCDFPSPKNQTRSKSPKNCPSCGHRKGEALFLYCTDEQMLEISLLLLLLSSKVTFSFWRLNNLFLSFSKREKERNHSKF